jgi:hypothetical protein
MTTHRRLGIFDHRDESEDILGLESRRPSLSTSSLGLLSSSDLLLRRSVDSGSSRSLLGRGRRRRRRLELVLPRRKLEPEPQRQLSNDLLLLEPLDEVLRREDISVPRRDLALDLGSERLGRELGPGGGRVGDEGRRGVNGLGGGLKVGADEAVEEVGDDSGVLVGEETLDERSENSLGGSEDHLLVDDDLEGTRWKGGELHGEGRRRSGRDRGKKAYLESVELSDSVRGLVGREDSVVVGSDDTEVPRKGAKEHTGISKRSGDREEYSRRKTGSSSPHVDSLLVHRLGQNRSILHALPSSQDVGKERRNGRLPQKHTRVSYGLDGRVGLVGDLARLVDGKVRDRLALRHMRLLLDEGVRVEAERERLRVVRGGRDGDLAVGLLDVDVSVDLSSGFFSSPSPSGLGSLSPSSSSLAGSGEEVAVSVDDDEEATVSF